jgi:glutathione S-transferase
VSDSLKAVEAFFDVAEKFLEERKYMAGNEFTLVDLYYIPLVKRLFVCGFGDAVTGRKNVGEWWERVSGRPAVKEVMSG